MKTAAIKILSLALISGIMLSAVGCRRTIKIAGNGSDYASEYWITEEVDGENTASGRQDRRQGQYRFKQGYRQQARKEIHTE